MPLEKEEQTYGSQNDGIHLQRIVYLAEDRSTVKKEDEEEIDLEKAIVLAGFGRFHAGVIIISGLCFMSIVLETMGISFILPAAQCDLALDTSEKGYLSGAVFLGLVISAHGWGLCADIFGRRKVLVISCLGCWIFSFLSSFASSAVVFIVLRFLTGLFLSGASSTVYAYLSEFLPYYNRVKVMTWTFGLVTAGYFMIPGVAWILLPVDINWNLSFIVYASWRLYMVILGSLLVIQVLGFFNLPETPKFLMSVGKKEEALKVLRYMYASNSGNSGDNYPAKNIKFEIAGLAKELDQTCPSKTSVTLRRLLQVMWRQTAPLFQPPYGWTSLIFCTLQVGIYVSSAGMYLWMPNLLNMMTTVKNLDSIAKPPTTVCEFVSYHVNHTSYSPIESTAECSNVIREEVYMSVLVIGVLYVVAFTGFGGIVNILGKRNLLILALLLSGIAGTGAYFAQNEIAVALLLSLYIVLSGACVGILSAAIVDAYPTHLRAMAVSLALTSGRLGSAIAGNVIGILIEYNCDATMIVMACVSLGCAALCFFLKK